MDNKQIYKKTLGFSLRRLLWDFLSLILLAGACTLGFVIGQKMNENGPIGLLIGALVGILLVFLVTHFISFKLKAGQIAMMTRGVTEGELPDDVIGEGKRVVRERFATVAVFYAITGAIRGIFNQLGRGITKLGEHVGGDAGGAIGGAVSSVMQTIVSYLCDCCLGWVFFRKDVKPAKAACEGAVLYFKHGKTFFKNMGRIFGMGLVSLILIGGPFTALFYWILSGHPEFYGSLATQLAESMADSTSNPKPLLTNPNMLPILFAAIGGILIWAFVHSTFIRPLVLVGVLRNYIESGKNEVPSEASFAALDSKSAKFRKLHSEL